MEMTWKDCLDENKARGASPDTALARAMVEMSGLRLDFLKSQKIDEKNASIIMSEYYEAMREVCEALISMKGYKVYSHECITFFLREVVGEDRIADIFDRYRKIRNKINYYGKKVGAAETMAAADEIKSTMSQLRRRM